jgi:hypothetical protein
MTMPFFKTIAIDTSAILITFKCNLKCKLCCTASPYQINPTHFTLDRLSNAIDKYFEVISYIRKLSFGGGEPMLHPHIDRLIESTMCHRDKFDILEIITNGTIIPNAQVLKVIGHYNDKIHVMIDHYGKISYNAEKLDELYSEQGINHYMRTYHGTNAHMGGWVDLGDYSHKNSKEYAGTLLRECCISSQPKRHTGLYKPIVMGENTLHIPYLAMTDGVLHRCARSYSTMQAGSINIDSDCFVNIMDSERDVNDIRQQICDLYLNQHLSACEYCNGFSSNSKRYMPAEQLVT